MKYAPCYKNLSYARVEYLNSLYILQIFELLKYLCKENQPETYKNTNLVF